MANVSAQEQLMLELINRARLDPLAEAARFGIDLNASLTPGTITPAPKAVLAMNTQLVASARAHSLWMLEADVFNHTGSGGSTASTRMVAAGYVFTGFRAAGENISWMGAVPGPIDLSTAIVSQHQGLFLSSGHRTNILSDNYREIGIAQERGMFLANGTDFSASMVTQNFARSGTNLFLTGVAYTDSTNDDFYGIGEGAAGVSVSRQGGGSATTGSAGGYELVFTAAGAQTITFGAVTVGLTLPAANVKLDLVNGNEIRTNATVNSLSGAAGAFLLGIESIGATGGTAGETLVGNAGANQLSGLGGNDVLIGDGPVSLSGAAQQIRRLYVATLDRAPDDLGWTSWATQREGGQALNDIAAGFVNSSEFQGKYGALSNAGFVTLLYRNVLDREPDANGLAAYTGALNSGGLTRTQAVTSFSESAEFIAGTSPALHAGQIFRLYGATLARAPDAGGFATWTDGLGNGRALVDIAAGFVNSSEFQTKYGNISSTNFVTLLYQNVLGRAPDAGGLAYWTGQLDSALQSRTQVVTGFSESSEYIVVTRAGTDAFMRTVMTAWSDTIAGGAGDDKLTGGRGSDRFVFAAGEGGNDTVYGFESFDTLQLTGLGFATSAAALAAATQQGTNTVLTYVGGTITFADAPLSVLQSLPAQAWVLG